MKPKTDSSISSDIRSVICSVWGLNDCGQLMTNNENIIKCPMPIQLSKGAFNIFSGDLHTLLVNDELKLFSVSLGSS